MSRSMKLVMFGLTINFAPYALVLTMVCATLIRCINRYPAFFKQERVGQNGSKFVVYKLQTMRPLKPGERYLNSTDNAARSDRLGTFLRNHGLDELPQFLNIARGDMHLIGPRPLMVQNLATIRQANSDIEATVDHWIQKRQIFKPGITGWHQINSQGPGIIAKDLEFASGLSWSQFSLIIYRSILVLPCGKRVLPGHPRSSK